jgi:hypothetical protein
MQVNYANACGRGRAVSMGCRTVGGSCPSDASELNSTQLSGNNQINIQLSDVIRK